MNWREKYEGVKNLKIGDKVLVRDDLEINTNYGDDIFIVGMKHTRGKVVTIDKVYRFGCYKIKENGWTFTDKMFKQKI